MRHILFVFNLLLISNIAFAHEIKINDLFNREVLIPEKVEKILALGSGSLRLVTYAGAQNLVSGRELFEETIDKSLRPYTYALPDNYNKLPIVSAGGPGVMPDADVIKQISPDVIFASSLSKDKMDMLNWQTGVPVVGLTYGDLCHTDLKKIKESLRLIGYITHTQERTQALLNKMAMLHKDIYSRSNKQTKKTVYMAAISFKGERQFCSTERNHPACNMLHIHNIADGISLEMNQPAHVILDIAYIINKQPQYIFYDITGLNDLRKNYQQLYPSFTKIKAVNEKTVYSVMPNNWYNSNIENMYLTAYYMGKIVYPDSFKDVDIRVKANDIYRSFLSTDPFDDINKKHDIFKNILFSENGFKFK